MSAVAFDTCRVVKTLKEAGLTENQASAITDSVKEMSREAELATKRDLHDLEVVFRADTHDLEVALRVSEPNLNSKS